MERKLKWYEYKDEEGNIRLNMNLILKRSLLGIVIIFIVIASTVFMLSYWGAPLIMPANEIGDTFGIASSIFSALAFALLIYTSLLQREELIDNRSELKRSAKIQENLVNLTNEQIEVLKRINRDKLYPELKLKEGRNNEDDSIRFMFTIAYESLKVEDISAPYEGAVGYNKGPKYLEPGDNFELNFHSDNLNDRIRKEELHFNIIFRDGNDRIFHQKLKLIKDQWVLSDPTPIDSETFKKML